MHDISCTRILRVEQFIKGQMIAFHMSSSEGSNDSSDWISSVSLPDDFFHTPMSSSSNNKRVNCSSDSNRLNVMMKIARKTLLIHRNDGHYCNISKNIELPTVPHCLAKDVWTISWHRFLIITARAKKSEFYVTCWSKSFLDFFNLLKSVISNRGCWFCNIVWDNQNCDKQEQPVIYLIFCYILHIILSTCQLQFKHIK